MKIERKLEQWRSAGLVDDATVARVLEFERGSSSPVVPYALGGVGASAIVLGFVAIIASNWDAIPPLLKLAVDGALAAGLALAILRSRPGWVREILVVLNYGFVLASMSLIGQIYHLDSGTWRALLAWSLATGPMMLLARGRFTAVLWIAGLVTTHGFVLFEWIEWLDDATGIDRRALVNVAVASVGIAPLLYLLVSRIAWLARERPAMAATFRATGWAAVALLVLAAATLFYEGIGDDDTVLAGPSFLLLAYGAFAAALPRIEAAVSPRALLGMRVLLVAGPLIGLLAVAGGRGAWPVLAALLQIVALGFLAWTALQAGHEGLFRVGVAAVCVRLLGVYIEVFGSLLETGLGLIVGGLLTIALTWFWLRKSRGLAAALSDRGPSAGDAGGSTR